MVERGEQLRARRRSGRSAATAGRDDAVATGAARRGRSPPRLSATRLPGRDAVDNRAEGLDRPRTRAGRAPGSITTQIVAGERPVGQGPGHDGAAALGGEDAVDPETRSGERSIAAGVEATRSSSATPQVVETLTGRYRDGDDRRTGRKVSATWSATSSAGELERLRRRPDRPW